MRLPGHNSSLRLNDPDNAALPTQLIFHVDGIGKYLGVIPVNRFLPLITGQLSFIQSRGIVTFPSSINTLSKSQYFEKGCVAG